LYPASRFKEVRYACPLDATGGIVRCMITCHVRYEIDPDRIEDFERFARRWMELVAQHGGVHHGYFLPSEGENDIAYALFSFSSLAEYERYRERFGVDPAFIEADRIRDESQCVRRYQRTFLRPLLPGAGT
jgi:NIPSNAP